MRVALIGVGLLAVLAGLWMFGPSLPDLQSDLTEFQRQLDHGQGWRDRNPRLAALIFLGVFSVAGALPIPVVVLLTLTGGAFFGFWLGFALSITATVSAALLTFLTARHLLTGPVRRVLGRRIDQLDQMVETDGALALLSLRLTPALPFFALNLASGVSHMSVRIFAAVTALGVLPNKAILTAAGTQLAEIDRLSQIMGPRIVAIIALLTIFPWAARWISRRLRKAAPDRV